MTNGKLIISVLLVLLLALGDRYVVHGLPQFSPDPWDIRTIRSQGESFFIESIPKDDPLRERVEGAVKLGVLSLRLNELSDPEIASLCDYRAVERKKGRPVEQCPRIPPQPTMGPERFSRAIEAQFVFERIEKALPPPIAMGEPPTPPSPLMAFPPEIRVAEGRAAAAVAGEPVPTAAYWNSWFQPLNNDQADPQEEVRSGHDYAFYLDLSSLRLSALGVHSAEPGEKLKEEMINIPGNKLTVYVRPVLAGRGLEFLDPTDAKLHKMEISLNKLRLSHLPEPKKEDESIQAFADRVMAGRVKFTVRTTEEGGCGLVALSIWSQAQDHPLDHVVRGVMVRGKDSGQEPCAFSSMHDKGLRSGLFSLFALEPDAKAVAGLHIFKLNARSSAAIYVEPSEGQSAKSYAWTFRDDLAQYMLHDKTFLKSLSKGREPEGSYAEAAKQVSDALFSAMRPDQESQVEQAKTALAGLVKNRSASSFYVRLVDADGTNLFLPLGLLKVGTGQDSSLLGDKMTLLQPLPRERHWEKKPCLSRWTFVLPDKLDRLTVPATKTLYDEHRQEIDSAGSNRRIGTKDDFECYLKGKTAEECRENKYGNTHAEPEGFLMLAHHADGNVWFEDQSNPIRHNAIKQQFLPGSVAILVACGAGDVQDSQHRIVFLDKLNEKGIDAAIVSPFEIPLDLGVAFAKHFDTILLDAYKQLQPGQQGSSLIELFNRTVDTIRGEQSKDNPSGSLKYIKANPKYEFVLVGDGGLRLCKPEGGTP